PKRFDLLTGPRGALTLERKKTRPFCSRVGAYGDEPMTESAKDAGNWLAAARAGSHEALGRALEICRGYLLLGAERQLGTDLRAKGGASDLVQETFLEAQRDFVQFQGTSEEELRAWLQRLLLNNLGNFARRYRATHCREVGREQALEAGSSSSPG